MLKWLSNLFSRNAATDADASSSNADNQVAAQLLANKLAHVEKTQLGNQTIAKVNFDELSPEEQQAMLAQAREMSNFSFFKGEVEHGYALRFLDSPNRCPRCRAKTEQKYANFIYATQIEPRLLLAPAGHFCSKCPTAIIDEAMIASGVTEPYEFSGVLGIHFEEEGQKPCMFKTWNGRKAVYIVDENETVTGLVEDEDAQQRRKIAKTTKDKKKQRQAKDARKRNRAKK